MTPNGGAPVRTNDLNDATIVHFTPSRATRRGIGPPPPSPPAVLRHSTRIVSERYMHSPLLIGYFRGVSRLRLLRRDPVYEHLLGSLRWARLSLSHERPSPRAEASALPRLAEAASVAARPPSLSVLVRIAAGGGRNCN